MNTETRKKIFRLAWCVFIIVMMIAAIGCRRRSPEPTYEPPVETVYYRSETVMAAELNVRAMPSNKAKILGQLYSGDVVDILGRDGNWIQIRNYDYNMGWVYGAYLTGFPDIKSRSSKRGRRKAPKPAARSSVSGTVRPEPVQESQTESVIRNDESTFQVPENPEPHVEQPAVQSTEPSPITNNPASGAGNTSAPPRPAAEESLPPQGIEGDGDFEAGFEGAEQ